MLWKNESRHLDTYRVVNAPVVGCRSWGAAWLRDGLVIGGRCSECGVQKRLIRQR
jgi:hypothetical protein